MSKLTLRDLFAVVTIVAVLVAWWVDRSRLADEVKRLAEEVERLKDDRPWSIPAGQRNPYTGSTFTLDVF
jgi:hypothetical protein